jgi:outer membrane protein assembly factor BamB
MMRHRIRTAVVALAIGLAIGFAIPVPARAAGPAWTPRPVWSTPFGHGPLAVATDDQGDVVTTNLGDVRALDARGHERWGVQVGGAPTAPVIDGDTVVVAGIGGVWAFARDDGALRWQRDLEVTPRFAAAGAGIAVVVDLRGTLRTFDLVTGDVRWTLEHRRPVHHVPVVDAVTATMIVVAPASPAPVVRALDTDTGATRWEAPVDPSIATPRVHAGRVYVAEGDDHFHAVVVAYDLRDGEPHWATRVRASFEASIVPAVDDRTLAVVDHLGLVTALRPDDGVPLWARDLGQTVLSTRIVLTRARVVVSTAAWDVVALDRANGRIERRVTARRLGGWAVDIAAAPFVAAPERLVAAIRLGDRERVEAWRLDGPRRPERPKSRPLH